MSRRPNTDERRAEIVTGLLAVMAEHGYDGASIGDIATSARLAPGLIHYHFSNKLEILVEATRRLASDHQAQLDRALATTTSAAEALDTVVDVHLGLGAHADRDRLACWIQIAGEAIRHPEICVEYHAVIAKLAIRVERIILNGIAVGELACDEPRAAGAAIAAAIQGYLVMAATARDVIPRGSAAASTCRMIDGLVQRVRSRQRRAAASTTQLGSHRLVSRDGSPPRSQTITEPRATRRRRRSR